MSYFYNICDIDPANVVIDPRRRKPTAKILPKPDPPKKKAKGTNQYTKKRPFTNHREYKGVWEPTSIISTAGEFIDKLATTETHPAELLKRVYDKMEAQQTPEVDIPQPALKRLRTEDPEVAEIEDLISNLFDSADSSYPSPQNPAEVPMMCVNLYAEDESLPPTPSSDCHVVERLSSAPPASMDFPAWLHPMMTAIQYEVPYSFMGFLQQAGIPFSYKHKNTYYMTAHVERSNSDKFQEALVDIEKKLFSKMYHHTY